MLFAAWVPVPICEARGGGGLGGLRRRPRRRGRGRGGRPGHARGRRGGRTRGGPCRLRGRRGRRGGLVGRQGQFHDLAARPFVKRPPGPAAGPCRFSPPQPEASPAFHPPGEGRPVPRRPDVGGVRLVEDEIARHSAALHGPLGRRQGLTVQQAAGLQAAGGGHQNAILARPRRGHRRAVELRLPELDARGAVQGHQHRRLAGGGQDHRPGRRGGVNDFARQFRRPRTPAGGMIAAQPVGGVQNQHVVGAGDERAGGVVVQRGLPLRFPVAQVHAVEASPRFARPAVGAERHVGRGGRRVPPPCGVG